MNIDRYIKKFQLKEKEYFSQKEFMKDFRRDFNDMIEHSVEMNNGITKDQFHNCINTMREAWKDINNISLIELPEKLWNFFYAKAMELKEKTCKDV